MEPNKNYLLVGSFVLVGLLAAIVFALWLTNSTEKRDYVYYQISFHESVGGLNNGSPVKYRGVDIGNVVAIKIDFEKADTIIARIRILNGSPVRPDTVATLKIQGITGTSYIELSGGYVGHKMVEGSLVDKGELPEIPAKVSNIAALSNDVPQLIDKASHIASQTESLLNDETIAHTQDMIKRLDNISVLMETNAAQLDGMIKTTSHLVETADKVASQVEASNVGDTMKELHDTFKELHATSTQFKELATHANKSTETSFVELSQLLQDAKKTSQEMRNFTHNLKENPSQVIFPTRDKQEKLP